MNVLFTFDVEIWCNSWATLDADFPTSFERYVFGRSGKGEYGLPKTLEILNQNDLKAVFFVEPLFAARFGVEPLARVVDLINQAGQEIQLHLHPEWTDEATAPLLPNVRGKRQHLSFYTLLEQQQLIAHGLRLLGEAGATPPNAFRSGSFSCNADTFEAVAANGLRFDSSINPSLETSQPGNARNSHAGCGEPYQLGALSLYPMTVFRDGFGRMRHAQVGACSVRELSEAILNACENGWGSFVLLSHNFELMIPARSDPDRTVVRRFEQICRFLALNHRQMPTRGFHEISPPPPPRGLIAPHVGPVATTHRYIEQALRRLNS